MLNPHLQLLHPPQELKLQELRLGIIDAEATAMGGAYKSKDLLRWSEINTFRIQKQIARAHIDSMSESLGKVKTSGKATHRSNLLTTWMAYRGQ